jgi:flagellar hook-associated protein FlgK
LACDEILDAAEMDRVLDRLAELMQAATSPTVRAVLLEAADEIAELFNENSDEDTEIENERQAA